VPDGRYAPQRNWGPRLREVLYQGMRLVILENEALRIGVLAGKGADVVELNYKPRDLDFVWLAPGGVRNPLPHAATAPDRSATFRENYPGGWQELFPNAGAPTHHDGAEMGQHGEVYSLPWDVEIIADSEEAVAVRCSIEARTVPCRLEKTFWLRAGEAGFRIEQRLVNLSPVPVRAMWGHHITFGAPFLMPGSRIRLPEGISVLPHPEAIAPGGRRVGGMEPFAWPIDPVSGLDLSVIPEPGSPSDLVYLTGFHPDDAWYEVARPEGGPAARIAWDGGVMPYCWFWQEFGASVGYPWYGRLSTIGLEPGSSYPNDGLAAAVANGSALALGPHEERRFWLKMSVLDP
jgi:hypothetical protein